MSSNNSSTNPEIERLTREMNRARDKSETWDGRNIKILIVAGIIAVGLALCGIKLSSWNRRVLRTTDELNRAKDRQLALDLQELSGTSSFALAEAGMANERAAKANQRAAELLALVQPRDLTVEQQKAIGNKLKQFAGQFVLILAYQDPESARLSAIISSALTEAKIHPERSVLAEGFDPDPRTGVVVTGPNQDLVNGISDALFTIGHLELAPKNTASSRSFGGVSSTPMVSRPPAATVYVGMKPLKFATTLPK